MRGVPLVPVISVVAMLFASWHVVQSQSPLHQAQPPIDPARTPFSVTVAGAGVVEPRSQNISISAVVPGVVTSVAVREGDRVEPGAVLFELDAREVEAELAVKLAALKSAESELARWEQMPRSEELPPLRRSVEAAEAHYRQWQDTFERRRQLLAKGATTEEEFIRTREQRDSALAELRKAEAQEALMLAGAWTADLAVSRANVESRRAEVEKYRVERERRVIRAPLEMRGDSFEPIAWQVLQVNIRPGEYVSTPPAEPSLVLGDLGPRRVRVDIDEHDLPRFQSGKPARGFARGDASTSYELRFVRIDPFVIPKKSLTGDNSERVDTRVLQVLYEFVSDAPAVYVGQQMDVYVDLKQQ